MALTNDADARIAEWEANGSTGALSLTSLPTSGVLPATVTVLCIRHVRHPPTLPPSLIELIWDLNVSCPLPILTRCLLTYLHCASNDLVELPDLPSTLQQLHCNDNKLRALPDLPPTLTHLYCDDNKLTALPDLPPTLTHLHCNYNELTSLPILPDTLEVLQCSRNKITALPSLPAALTQLRCDENWLTALPTLPAQLHELVCCYNLIKRLPNLPVTLNVFACQHNPVAFITFPPGVDSYYMRYGKNNWIVARNGGYPTLLWHVLTRWVGLVRFMRAHYIPAFKARYYAPAGGIRSAFLHRRALYRAMYTLKAQWLASSAPLVTEPGNGYLAACGRFTDP